MSQDRESGQSVDVLLWLTKTDDVEVLLSEEKTVTTVDIRNLANVLRRVPSESLQSHDEARTILRFLSMLDRFTSNMEEFNRE
jgi:dsDNA-specific endonuclease/ATPase MutS2